MPLLLSTYGNFSHFGIPLICVCVQMLLIVMVMMHIGCLFLSFFLFLLFWLQHETPLPGETLIMCPYVLDHHGYEHFDNFFEWPSICCLALVHLVCIAGHYRGMRGVILYVLAASSHLPGWKLDQFRAADRVLVIMLILLVLSWRAQAIRGQSSCLLKCTIVAIV